MNEKDLRIFEQCLKVLEYINIAHKTNFTLTQKSATLSKMLLANKEQDIFCGNLKSCDNFIAGMLILSKIIKT